MLIKKFNSSFALCLGVLISSVCQSVSSAQTTSVNRSDCIVKTENQKDREFSRKIVDVGKKFKNKLANVNDSILKEVYTPFFTAFGAGLTYKILTDGINYYYFDEKNKTPGDAIEPEDKKEIERETSNSSEIIQKEENEISDFSQTKEKNNDQSNNSVVTPNNQNTESSNDVEPTDKITEDNSGDNLKEPVPKTTDDVTDSSKNLDTTQETSRENSSNNPEGITTKTNKEKSTYVSNGFDAKVKTDEPEGDLKPIYFGVYSDLLLYFLINLTPKEWGLQKAWYDFWHDNTTGDSLKKLFGSILFVKLIINVCMLFLCFNEEKTNVSWGINSLIKYIFLFVSCFSPSFNSASGAVKSFNNVTEDIKENDEKEKNNKLEYTILRALRGFFSGYNVEIYFSKPKT